MWRFLPRSDSSDPLLLDDPLSPSPALLPPLLPSVALAAAAAVTAALAVVVIPLVALPATQLVIRHPC